ncbi:uncharacterized protein [Asterias amurensis]|uniref:uncharacterized protein n=1 Tax=Asterias amurensis TaxID=7602 RepID=UPI003AB4B7D4
MESLNSSNDGDDPPNSEEKEIAEEGRASYDDTPEEDKSTTLKEDETGDSSEKDSKMEGDGELKRDETKELLEELDDSGVKEQESPEVMKMQDEGKVSCDTNKEEPSTPTNDESDGNMSHSKPSGVKEQDSQEVIKSQDKGNLTCDTTTEKPSSVVSKPTENKKMFHTKSSQPQTIAVTSTSIIIDLGTPQVMGKPKSRDGHTQGGNWTGGVGNGHKQGGCKSVDFSFPANMEEEVDAELARVISASNDNQSLFELHEYGRGATTNTPVTVMTDYAESFSQIQGRGLHTPSRENLYEHALTIMKKRCRSSRTGTSNVPTFYRPNTPDNIVEENGTAFPVLSLPAVVANTKDPPLVRNPNRLFYVAQKRQHPIAPIKAWTGYHGNVYFQPMVCKKADFTPSTTPRENALNVATRRVYSRPIMNTKKPDNQLPQLPQSEFSGVDGPQSNTDPSIVATDIQSIRSQHTVAPSNREKSLSRAASTAKSRASTARQLAVLDKQSVFNTMDSNIREDIQWISGLEAMGTLHIGGLKRPRSTARFYKNTEKHHKLKIQRGLVSHKLAAHDQSLPTLLGIHGGRLNDSADGVAKTKHLESQYQACKGSKPNEDDDNHAYSPNIFGGYSGPFTSIEQLRRDSVSSPINRGNSNTSSEQLLKNDSLHSMTSAFKSCVNTVPLYSSKEVLFRNREALFLTRPNYK